MTAAAQLGAVLTQQCSLPSTNLGRLLLPCTLWVLAFDLRKVQILGQSRQHLHAESAEAEV